MSSYRRGIVSAVDPETCRARVKFPDKGDAESWWLEVLQGNTQANQDYRLPDAGELVAVMLDERAEAGCILGALYTDSKKPPSPSADVRRVTFSDGCSVTYDRSSSVLTVAGASKVEVVGDTPVEIGGAVTIGDGTSAVALAMKVGAQLSALKGAIAGAATAPADGGAAFKAALLTALGSWPADTGAEKLSSD